MSRTQFKEELDRELGVNRNGDRPDAIIAVSAVLVIHPLAPVIRM
jgi:hypothetical protein